MVENYAEIKTDNLEIIQEKYWQVKIRWYNNSINKINKLNSRQQRRERFPTEVF